MNASAKNKPVGAGKSLSAMEADVAYFDASLALVGDAPATAYQCAQVKVFATLVQLSNVEVTRRKSDAKRSG